MRAGDDADAHDLAERLRCDLAGFGCGLDGSDVSGHDGRDHGVADLGHGADEFDVGGFQHRVRRLDEGDKAAGFNKSECLL